MERKIYDLYYCTAYGTLNHHPFVSNADDIEDWIKTLEFYGNKLYEIRVHERF